MAEMDEKPQESSGSWYKDRLKKKSAAPPTEEHAQGSGDGGVQNLAKVHPEAAQASKSFHAYQGHDGKLTAHAHDHKAGTHEQREHVSMADVAQHMHEHMGEEKQEIRAEREGGQGEPQMGGGMEQLGMGM